MKSTIEGFNDVQRLSLQRFSVIKKRKLNMRSTYVNFINIYAKQNYNNAKPSKLNELGYSNISRIVVKLIRFFKYHFE